jgi:hypothetical protein
LTGKKTQIRDADLPVPIEVTSGRFSQHTAAKERSCQSSKEPDSSAYRQANLLPEREAKHSIADNVGMQSAPELTPYGKTSFSASIIADLSQ